MSSLIKIRPWWANRVDLARPLLLAVLLIIFILLGFLGFPIRRKWNILICQIAGWQHFLLYLFRSINVFIFLFQGSFAVASYWTNSGSWPLLTAWSSESNHYNSLAHTWTVTCLFSNAESARRRWFIQRRGDQARLCNFERFPWLLNFIDTSHPGMKK